ncbi:MAG: anaerobic ribonucleoside-triphosphate reductase activating protein [Acutalibacteraceae bacterium]
MLIAGLQKLTLLDYPEKTACTVFTYGCNFLCPFCHNATLVTEKAANLLTQEEILSFLEKRQGLLDAVCITGGEPTLHKDLPEFIKKIRDLGYLVKLDTNGSRPEILKDLLEKKLIDYVAMDIKNALSRYGETVGLKDFDIKPILNSIEILKKSGVTFEFRTTVTKELHSEKDIREILSLIGKEAPYYLQQFKAGESLIADGNSPWEESDIKSLVQNLQGEGYNLGLRGV